MKPPKFESRLRPLNPDHADPGQNPEQNVDLGAECPTLYF